MRHSSRIMKILCFSTFTLTAIDAGALANGGGVGGVRGLSPVRPVVGFSRGLSPTRPVVGSSRGLSPTRFKVGQQTILGSHPGPFRARQIAGGRFAPGGIGYGGAGFIGTPIGYSAGPYAPTPDSAALGDDVAPTIVLAPPPPCIHPQIIQIGRSAHIDAKPVARGHAGRFPVRVVYGRPPCGAI